MYLIFGIILILLGSFFIIENDSKLIPFYLIKFLLSFTIIILGVTLIVIIMLSYNQVILQP